MKRRLGILDASAWRQVTLAWRALRDTQLADVSIIEQYFVAASELIERPDLVLRSGDALHLAIVIRHGLSLATVGRKFADAARMMAVDPALELPEAST